MTILLQKYGDILIMKIKWWIVIEKNKEVMNYDILAYMYKSTTNLLQ